MGMQASYQVPLILMQGLDVTDAFTAVQLRSQVESACPKMVLLLENTETLPLSDTKDLM